MTARRAAVPLAVAVAGAMATAFVADVRAMPGKDTLQLAGLAVGGAAAAALLGSFVLWAFRRAAVRTQLVVVVLTATAGVGAGAFAAADGMFISAHDRAALDVVLVAAGTAAVVLALVLGGRVGRASAALAGQVSAIGSGGGVRVDGAPRELAQLSAALEETTRRLEESRARERSLDESRRELIAWVSHDLRTPLAAIRAVAEALDDRVVEDPETVARYHSTLREESERLAGLVDDLFELSRTQAGALRLEFEQVSLGDLVSDVLAGLAPVAQAKGVRLEGRLAGPPPEIRCSAPEVLRALRSILENAIRHTPSDGTVVVEAGSDDEGAFVSVVDTGGGIPEADLERVFETAFRGDRARTPGDGGGGLGLTIARGLVEAHEGEITVHNEGDGCRFTVRLPGSTASEGV
ncbi:MAG TPA: HAMP domain-containing sensor histidine kinase [Acidimicrobiia bacterium]|nr:HAMP domain-containing sensor histidine kinase [Acidimicrobiia bacterium]